MIMNTIRLIATRVGIMISSRRTTYWSILRSSSGRGRARGVLEPEAVGLEDPEVSPGDPAEHGVLGHVLQAIRDHDRLQRAAHDSDRERLLGENPEHLVPNRLALARIVRAPPGRAQLKQSRRLR